MCSEQTMDRRKTLLLDQNQLAKELGVNRRTINRWRKQNKLPPPLVDDRHRPFWSQAQISRWLSSDPKRDSM